MAIVRLEFGKGRKGEEKRQTEKKRKWVMENTPY